MISTSTSADANGHAWCCLMPNQSYCYTQTWMLGVINRPQLSVDANMVACLWHLWWSTCHGKILGKNLRGKYPYIL